MSMLKVENLSVHYGMIQAVRDVSFEVNEGEVVSLIGANGAGKTSILRTISGLVRPSAGKIEFLGQDLQTLQRIWVHRIDNDKVYQLGKTRLI